MRWRWPFAVVAVLAAALLAPSCSTVNPYYDASRPHHRPDGFANNYAAPLEALDFARNPSGGTKQINTWVEEQTRQRIRALEAAIGISYTQVRRRA